MARQLGFQPGITVLERWPSDGAPPDGPSVAVMVVDRLDERALAELRRLTRSGGRKIVLIAGELREPEFVAALECRLHGVLWRHEVTGDRLASAVRSAAYGGSHHAGSGCRTW